MTGSSTLDADSHATFEEEMVLAPLPPLGFPGGPGEDAEKWQEIRDAVAEMATTAYEGKVDKLWTTAGARLKKMMSKQEQTIGCLELQLSRCQEESKKMEQDRDELRQAVALLLNRLTAAEAMLGIRGDTLDHLLASPASTTAVGAQTVTSGPSSPDLTDSGAEFVLDIEPDTSALASEVSVEPKTRADASARAPEVEPKWATMSPRKDSALDVPDMAPPGLLLSPIPTSSPMELQSSMTQSPKLLPSPFPSAQARSSTPTLGAKYRTPPQTPERVGPQRSRNAGVHLKSPMVPQSPYVICENGSSIFGFHIRVVDGGEVGLEVNPVMDFERGEQILKVVKVRCGGAIDSWNKQCIGGPAAGKAIMVGDTIVGVNDAKEPDSMIEECQTKKLLRFTISRGSLDCDFGDVWADKRRRSNAGLSNGNGTRALPAHQEPTKEPQAHASPVLPTPFDAAPIPALPGLRQPPGSFWAAPPGLAEPGSPPTFAAAAAIMATGGAREVRVPESPGLRVDAPAFVPASPNALLS